MKYKPSPPQQQQQQQHKSTSGGQGSQLHDMEAEIHSLALIINLIQTSIHTLNLHIMQYGTNYEAATYLSIQEKQLEDVLWREGQLRVKLEMHANTNVNVNTNTKVTNLSQSPTAQSGFGLLEQGEIEHRFSDKSYVNGTCSLCEKKITERKAAKCDHCSYACHTKCVSMAKPTCIQPPINASGSRAGSGGPTSYNVSGSGIINPKARLTGRTRSAGTRDAFPGLSGSGIVSKPQFPIHLGRQNSDRPRAQRAATLVTAEITRDNVYGGGVVSGGGTREYSHTKSPGTNLHVHTHGSMNDVSSVSSTVGGSHYASGASEGVYNPGNTGTTDVANSGTPNVLRAHTVTQLQLQTRTAGEMSLPTSPTQPHDRKHTVKGVLRSISRTGRARSSSLDRRSDKPNASVLSAPSGVHGEGGSKLAANGPGSTTGSTNTSLSAHPSFGTSHAVPVGAGAGVVQSATSSPKLGLEGNVTHNRHSRANSIIKGLQKSLRRSYSQRNLTDANMNSYIYHQQQQQQQLHGGSSGGMRESTSTGSTGSHGSYGTGTPPRDKIFSTNSRHGQSKSTKDLYESGVKDTYVLDRNMEPGAGLAEQFAGVDLALVTEAKERPLRPLNMPSYDDSYRGLRSDSIGEEVEDFTLEYV
ncbi:hypothetical protein SARC_13644 [Sphaeroforma arctica JP610]|uniref:Phorbol-ester/DAG-type domain-containing protein n=1 Tax=Sphaeroforma arctica JP610 TaxID=667725 RepID=A0A0L0FAM7_9EUKA|nr:hypothetical protein SARC_13644 [Sphaeroforma arctica JP610]KNC73799.1 hypothetical protein SARC_13644 [Sphaeroforma arctica JP610]|eukprot:XP_014147701.1 hypothetical protein SARC_13644 [Sphaeroforma arctica JP610]